LKHKLQQIKVTSLAKVKYQIERS